MSNSHSITASLQQIISAAGSEDTALLITDVRILKQRLDVLTQAFPKGTRHAVAIKTNPHKQILATILEHGFDLEAASMEEVELALSAGAEPQQIVFDSPVKTRDEIQRCARYSGMQVNANMLSELTHRAAGYALTRVEYVGEGTVPNIFIHVGADLFTRHVYASAEPVVFKVLDSDGNEKTGLKHAYNLAGPLCFAGDYLARGIELPTVHEGDWLLISEVGANTYGLWSRHCTRAIPKVLGIDLQGVVSQWSARQQIAY